MGLNNVQQGQSTQASSPWASESAKSKPESANPQDVSDFKDLMDAKKNDQSSTANRQDMNEMFEKTKSSTANRQDMNEMLEKTKSSTANRQDMNEMLDKLKDSQSTLAERAQQEAQVPLSDLFNMQKDFTSAMERAGQAQEVAPASAMDTENLEALVSRILVGANQAGDQEVRLTLNDEFLRNTEIMISRDSNGNLAVRIECSDPASFQTLVASRQNLQESLDAKEKGLVSIDLRNQNDDANDTNQRSRGLDQFFAGNENNA